VVPDIAIGEEVLTHNHERKGNGTFKQQQLINSLKRKREELFHRATI
jgi:hypothetical protein